MSENICHQPSEDKVEIKDEVKDFTFGQKDVKNQGVMPIEVVVNVMRQDNESMEVETITEECTEVETDTEVSRHCTP